MTDASADRRLEAVEARLDRLETLLAAVVERLDRAVKDTDGAQARPGSGAVLHGPTLPGTRIRCTDEVLDRLAHIPIPFVRQMVTEKVAEAARSGRIALVDVAFFERAATF